MPYLTSVDNMHTETMSVLSAECEIKKNRKRRRVGHEKERKSKRTLIM